MTGATTTVVDETTAESGVAGTGDGAVSDQNSVAAMPPAEPLKPNLAFKKELEEFGGTTFHRCYQCATCTTVCGLSTEGNPFPRKEMVWTQWGLEDKLVRDPDIWACHYCGDCSTKCPRGANPGELMMALRRYAISRYDWTGLSRRMYTSRAWEIGAILFVSAIVILLFAISGAFTSSRFNTDGMAVDTFISSHWVHYADWVMAGTLTFFLLTNACRMVFLILDGQRPPISVFISELKTFIIQMTMQRNWRNCDGSNRRWLKHFILVTGYVTMFTLVMIFIGVFQEDSANFTWVSLFGYYGTFAILYYSTDSIIGRLRKRDENHKFSHDSDWMFLILLFLTGLTGIVMHGLRLADMPQATYIAYVIHLAIAVPMLVVEVPFGKWSHLLYRPLALYIKAVKERARELRPA